MNPHKNIERTSTQEKTRQLSKAKDKRVDYVPSKILMPADLETLGVLGRVLLQLLAFLASNCYLERKDHRPLQIQRTKRAEFADGSKRLGVRGLSVQKAARKHLCIQFPLSCI